MRALGCSFMRGLFLFQLLSEFQKRFKVSVSPPGACIEVVFQYRKDLGDEVKGVGARLMHCGKVASAAPVRRRRASSQPEGRMQFAAGYPIRFVLLLHRQKTKTPTAFRRSRSGFPCLKYTTILTCSSITASPSV